MSDRPTPLPGTLMIDSVANDEVKNISLDMPIQVLRLKSYRVEMSSAANALSTRIIYVDLPFLNGNKVLDTNPGHTFFPLLLDNAAVTLRTGLNVPISMNTHLPQTFEVRYLNPSFGLVANLVSVSMIFESELGHL